MRLSVANFAKKIREGHNRLPVRVCECRNELISTTSAKQLHEFTADFRASLSLWHVKRKSAPPQLEKVCKF